MKWVEGGGVGNTSVPSGQEEVFSGLPGFGEDPIQAMEARGLENHRGKLSGCPSQSLFMNTGYNVQESCQGKPAIVRTPSPPPFQKQLSECTFSTV